MKPAQTRWPFRIMAGITGVFLLVVGLPMALVEIQKDLLTGAVFAYSTLVGGIGLTLAAYTGRWFNSPG